MPSLSPVRRHGPLVSRESQPLPSFARRLTNPYAAIPPPTPTWPSLRQQLHPRIHVALGRISGSRAVYGAGCSPVRPHSSPPYCPLISLFSDLNHRATPTPSYPLPPALGSLSGMTKSWVLDSSLFQQRNTFTTNTPLYSAAPPPLSNSVVSAMSREHSCGWQVRGSIQ
ncbi:hypothetical protein C8F01DRAFT_1177096 [Mycena amicta]|nr:hypothetical protein C8F01DRAFT_1177096 [Mycena amicta]